MTTRTAIEADDPGYDVVHAAQIVVGADKVLFRFAGEERLPARASGDTIARLRGRRRGHTYARRAPRVVTR